MSVQAHFFGDASIFAFCAVAYFRFLYDDGSIRCCFVMGKTRVAPLRQLSIPKLELQATVMCVRLLETVKKNHTYEFDSFHLWSDSRTVIQWISSSSRRHPTFIANRVAEIQDSTDPEQWRHVPGRLNVADDGSRGLNACDLHSECRWLNRPAFLSQPEEFWPLSDSTQTDEDGDKPDDTTAWTNAISTTSSHFLDLNRFSSWDKLLRVTTWILRFVRNCRRKKEERASGPLVIPELNEAKELWIRMAQEETFPAEVKCLKKAPISHQSRILTLSPFLDAKGILRAGGRISKAPLPYATRHPIILLPKCCVTKLIVSDYHHRYHHEGNEHVRNAIQQEFWILNCRATIRHIAHHCPYCHRRRVQPQVPMMADLPAVRLQANLPPFSRVGVDYFGPFVVKRFRKTEKWYCCLVTCLVTRCAHRGCSHPGDRFLHHGPPQNDVQKR